MQLLKGIGERKLVQWGLGYLAGSWLLLQVLDVLADVWSVPVMLQRTIQIAVALGLPAVLVIAWFHGKSGAQRVRWQEVIVVLIVAGGGVGVVLAIGRVDRSSGPSEEALRLFNEGQFHVSQFTPEGLQRGIVLLRQAIAEDSAFLAPYIALAHAYCSRGLAPAAMDPEEAMPLCRELAEKVIGLDEESADAHLMLALYYQDFAWDPEVVESELQRAFALGATSSLAHGIHSYHLAYAGRFEEARRESLRSVQQTPTDPISWVNAASIAYLAGDLRGAIEHSRRAISIDPENAFGHWIQGAAFAELTDSPDSSLRELQRFRTQGPPLFMAYLGYAYALSGDSTAARAIRAEVATASPYAGLSAVAQGVVSVGLGEFDQAIVMMQSAADRRSPILKFVLASPVGRRLAGTPGYHELRLRVGLR